MRRECFFAGPLCVFADCYAAQVRASSHYLWISLPIGCLLPSWLYMESGLEGRWLVVLGMPLFALCGAAAVRNPQQCDAAEPLSGELQREVVKAAGDEECRQALEAGLLDRLTEITEEDQERAQPHEGKAFAAANEFTNRDCTSAHAHSCSATNPGSG